MSHVNFSFDGLKYQGKLGEPLAAALLRAGVLHFTDSAYLNRPRGVMGLGVEEANAIVQLESGTLEPMLPATTLELVEGLSVSSLAGVGRLPDAPDTARYDKAYRHTDILVVGAGTAGMAEAKKQLDLGHEVVLIDDQPGPGGHLRHLGEAIPSHLNSIFKDPRLTYLPRTTVIGLYDQGFAVAVERRTDHLSAEVLPQMARIRTWHIRAAHVVLAPGAFQRPLVFANNDRPGIMLSHAAATYADQYQVRRFKRAVVVTVDNQGYRDAVRLHNAGVHVLAILDCRAHSAGRSVEAAKALGIPIELNSTALDTEGDPQGLVSAVKAIRLSPDSVAASSPTSGGSLKFDIDLLAVSGGWTPTVHLATFIGHKPSWSPAHAAFLIQRPSQTLSTAGMLAGEFGDDDAPSTFFGPALTVFDEEQEKLAFIDLQRDATLYDLKRAIGAGLTSIEHVKRYTTIGTAHDQGKTCGTTTMGLISQAIGQKAGAQFSPNEIGTLSFRPPYIPVPFVALAGRNRGLLLDPVRTTPIHDWHVRAGAPMEDVGQWKRPWYFPMPGEDMAAAVRRECHAARNGVAMMDASTLGKIDIQGPDAAIFLDRIYTNLFSTLKVGQCRYGLMCHADGMVFDDGVTTRLGSNHFLMTTTTGGAARVLAWLEEWLQTEWPDLKVYCTSVTEQIATLALVGPKSRELLSLIAPGLDVSQAAFAFMESREALVLKVPSRVARISFSGELAFEINVPAWYALSLWEQIIQIGKPLGITPYGTETMHVLRAEKGFVIVGQETDGTQTPSDLNMDWIVSKKKEFIGKRSFLRQDTSRTGRHQLVGLLPEDSNEIIPEGAYLLPWTENQGSSSVHHIGYITSSYYSVEMGRPFALAMVADGLKRLGETVKIPVGGDKVFKATLCSSVFIDKENKRRDGLQL